MRCQYLTVAGQDLFPVAVHVDLGHHADHRVGVRRRGVEQRAVGLGQRGRRRDHEHHRRRRFAGLQVRRLDELRVGQPFAQRGDDAGHPGQPRPGDQHGVEPVDARRVESGPDRGDHRVHLGNRVVAWLLGHTAPPTFVHSRSEPLTMSAPQARWAPVTGPRR